MDPSRALRQVALVATAVALLATIAHGANLAVSDPHLRPLTHMRVVEREGDYVAWTAAFAPSRYATVFYVANDTPDRIFLAREGDLPTILAGDPFTPITEFDPGPAMGPKSLGRLAFPAPSPTCPPPSGGCIDETIPVIIWVKGDAWRGVGYDERDFYVVTTETWTGPEIVDEPHDGPVRPSINVVSRSVIEPAITYLAVAGIAGAVGILAALGHAALMLRRPADEPLVPHAPHAESTETMLMFARLTTLYVGAIRRSFVVSLTAILGITVGVMFFGLPPMLGNVTSQFRYLIDLQEMHVALFVLAPLQAACVAIVLWGVAYIRVSRELREWHRRSRAFEDEEARLIGG